MPSYNYFGYLTIELRPLGVKCNLRCNYCYQNPQRDAGNIANSYDIKKMKEGIEIEGGSLIKILRIN